MDIIVSILNEAASRCVFEAKYTRSRGETSSSLHSLTQVFHAKLKIAVLPSSSYVDNKCILKDEQDNPVSLLTLSHHSRQKYIHANNLCAFGSDHIR